MNCLSAGTLRHLQHFIAAQIGVARCGATDVVRLVAGTDGGAGLYRSLDAGGEWERLEPPGLISRDLQDFASAEWGLVVATSNGVFLSADSGASFRELYAGLDTPDVRRVALAGANGSTAVHSARGSSKTPKGG